MTDCQGFSGQQAEKRKKIIQKNFKDKGLQIIIKHNLKIVHYLDVTLNLNDGTYHLFSKPYEETTYIHVKSDYLPQIIKKIPRSVDKRLSCPSSTKEVFENSEDYYEQSNILWFNPPYRKSVKTNIGKRFLHLINKHFPPTDKYRKIFNRSTVKFSVSSMSNIEPKISTHKKKIKQTSKSEHPKMLLYQQKHLPLKRKFPSREYPVYTFFYKQPGC